MGGGGGIGRPAWAAVEEEEQSEGRSYGAVAEDGLPYEEGVDCGGHSRPLSQKWSAPSSLLSFFRMSMWCLRFGIGKEYR